MTRKQFFGKFKCYWRGHHDELKCYAGRNVCLDCGAVRNER